MKVIVKYLRNFDLSKALFNFCNVQRTKSFVLIVGMICFANNVYATKFYPTNAEIKIFAQNLATTYPTIVSYHELTTASKDNTTPVIALKISDNTNAIEDEPVWVFSGYIHGREALGYKTVEMLAKELSSNYAVDEEITNWVNHYEIWLVLSGNPVGYAAKLRKNGPNTDSAQTSGVDLNRNWDFRWINGGESDFKNDRFRGNSAASENEVKALETLYLERQPIFGATFHQGNEPDGGQVMRPWSSAAASPPDSAKLLEQAQQLAQWEYEAKQAGPLCKSIDPLEDPNGQYCETSTTPGFCKSLCWEATQTTLGAYGQSSNAQYAKAGTIDLTIEMTDRLFNEPFLHSDVGPTTDEEKAIHDINFEVASNWKEALKSWLQSAWTSDTKSYVKGSGITGHITDATTGLPIIATVNVTGYSSEFIDERKSNGEFGRFHRFLPVGSHSVTISAEEYDDWSNTLTVDDLGTLNYYEISLTPSTVVTPPVVPPAVKKEDEKSGGGTTFFILFLLSSFVLINKLLPLNKR